MSKVVCIDPGHGGKDPGAVANGLKEKDITLAISLKLGKILEENGIKVVYTRTTDKYLSLTERANVSNKANADAFISIHTNSFTNPSARGLEIWTSKGQTKADILATYVGEELIKEFPNVPFRKDLSDGDLDKEANFTVLAKTKAPAILPELGFISNKQDNELQLKRQDDFAKAIANGIFRFFNMNVKADTKKKTVKISINGKTRVVEGYYRNGTNYVYVDGKPYPIRQVAAALGLKNIDWNNTTKTVIIKD